MFSWSSLARTAWWVSRAPRNRLASAYSWLCSHPERPASPWTTAFAYTASMTPLMHSRWEMESLFCLTCNFLIFQFLPLCFILFVFHHTLWYQRHLMYIHPQVVASIDTLGPVLGAVFFLLLFL